MATKQELELQVFDLQRQVSDLTGKLALSSGPDVPVQDDSEIHRLQDEIKNVISERDALADKISLKEMEIASLTNLVEEAHAELAQKRLAAPPTSSGYDLEIMQAWELVDKVKYQFLPKEAEVAIVRKR